MRFGKYLTALVGAAAVAGLIGAPHVAHADAMADAEALIKAHQVLPDYKDPGPAFDAKACMKDKKMLTIPLTMANPFNAEIAKAMTAAAAEVGFELKVWENQLKIDQWVQGMAAAESGGYSLIDLQGGIPPAALGPQIDSARAKGIKVTTTHLYDVTQDIPANLDGSARMNYTMAGKLMASWAYVKTGGKPNVVIIGSDEIVPTAPFVKSIQDTLKGYCPDCKQQYVNVPVTEWATKIQSSVQSALVADPSINFILPIYDSMSQFIVPALRITNRLGEVKIASYNGTPFVLDMVRTGEVDMDVGESLGWIGYAGIDVNMRILCGITPPVTDLNTPLYIFDASNIKSAGEPANFHSGYGDKHLEGFRKLWGLK